MLNNDCEANGLNQEAGTLGGCGIKLGATGTNMICQNLCISNYIGIGLHCGSLGVVISGNHCASTDYGIHIEPGVTGPFTDVSITGNVCEGLSLGGVDCGICAYDMNHSSIYGNVCYRGTGVPGDYTAAQNTIKMNNCSKLLVSNNLVLGKDTAVSGGSGNTLVNNKYQ